MKHARRYLSAWYGEVRGAAWSAAVVTPASLLAAWSAAPGSCAATSLYGAAAGPVLVLAGLTLYLLLFDPGRLDPGEPAVPWPDPAGDDIPPAHREMIARSRAAFARGETGEPIDDLIRRLGGEGECRP